MYIINLYEEFYVFLIFRLRLRKRFLNYKPFKGLFYFVMYVQDEYIFMYLRGVTIKFTDFFYYVMLATLCE